MMKTKHLCFLFALLLTGLLSACGGGGGGETSLSSSSGGSPSTGVRTGIAVDPYIVNARFEEVSADGTQIIQNSSTASDSRGRFAFAEPIQEGSIIRLKSSSRGMHGNAPFEGMLKSRAQSGTDQALVVSPLTTLLANGMGEDEVISMLESAGLSGLQPADLTQDPMQGLSGASTSVTQQQLRGLQANMAVNTMLMAMNDYDYAGQWQDKVPLADCVALTEETLSPEKFQSLASTISSEVGGSLTMNDVALAAVEVQRTVVSQIREDLSAGNSRMTPARFAQLRSQAASHMATVAREIVSSRVNTPPVVSNPDQGIDAAQIFTANCAGCHVVGGRNTVMNLSGDGALLDGKFGNGARHNGNSLTAAEISALATYLGGGTVDTPPTDVPTDPGTGGAADTITADYPAASFFSDNCTSCHDLAGSGMMNLSGDGALLDGKFGNGGSHNGNTLTANDISALAAYLDGSPAPVDPVPPVDNTSGDSITASYPADSFFADSCSVCHSLTGSGTMNLAGDGALLNGKFGNGASHNGNTLTANDISALASYLDANAATEPPPTPVTGSELYASECQGCHGSLATSSISNRTAAGISAAISANAGGMGYLVLTQDQLTKIVNALPAVSTPPEPTTPVADRSGVEVYDQECAGCHMLGSHDTAGNIDLASRGSAMITKIEGGHMGKTLTANELAAVADFANTFSVAPPPVVDRAAETIYSDICSTCHMLSGYDEAGSIDLAGLGSTVVTKVASGHGASLSNKELTDLAAWVDTFSPPAPPAVARDGQTVYEQTCAACHKVYGYDTVGNIDLAGKGSTALTKLASGHGGTVSADEQQNVAAWLDTWTPAPPPAVDRSGENVYTQNCAGCHKIYGYDAVGNVDLAGQGSLAVTKLGTGHGGSVTAGEIINLANWLDTFSPAPPPVVARGGQEIYDADCAGCHKVNGYDADGTAPDIAGNGSGAATKINGGHNGITLLAEELSNLSAWLDTYQAGDPYAGSCTACHGQPPQLGAHEVHTSLAGVGTDCAVCHDGASHNGSVDLAIQSSYDAKNGSASSNGSTCSSISCHGGQTTPDWNSGSLNSSTQCKSCHSYGTSQYNGYFSGRHRKHVSEERFDCLVCHDASKLGSGHFSNLGTISFEQSPASTIKSSLSYSGGTCSTASCHGRERW